MSDAPVKIETYHLRPTELIPNSPQPLLRYPGLLSKGVVCDPVKAYDLFSGNGWQVQWIFRYGPTQKSHYHSSAHECMAVLSGEATIRFGVADTVSDLEQSTQGSGKEEGGVEVRARAGDVFVLPAGVAHKTFDCSPVSSFELLTPGDGHKLATEAARESLAQIKLSGFTMLGAYPPNSVWDFYVGGENSGDYEKVWSTEKPANDPVLGQAASGLCGLWQSSQ